MGSGDAEAGILALQIFRRPFRHAGLCAQKEQGLPVFRHPLHQSLGEANAGDAALQGRAQYFCAVNDPDAVGQHQIPAVDGAAGLFVLPADLHDFRVGGDGVVGSRRTHQAHALGHRLLHGHVVKAHAQYINSHRFFSLPLPRFPIPLQYSIFFPVCPPGSADPAESRVLKFPKQGKRP